MIAFTATTPAGLRASRSSKSAFTSGLRADLRMARKPGSITPFGALTVRSWVGFKRRLQNTLRRSDTMFSHLSGGKDTQKSHAAKLFGRYFLNTRCNASMPWSTMRMPPLSAYSKLSASRSCGLGRVRICLDAKTGDMNCQDNAL